MNFLFGLTFGLSVTAIGVYLLYRSFWLRKNGHFVMGIITTLKRTYSIVEFKVNGHEFWFNAGDGYLIWFYGVGDQVPVLYHPKNPTDAIIKR